jgi:site-specific DNA recombinase
MNISELSPFPAGSIVYPYLRHSPGDNQNIDSQEAAVRDWCVRHQLVVPRVFKDEARSGASTAGRDDFLLLIDTLRDTKLKPKPAGVLLWSFSRMARDYDDAEFYKADLRRRGYIIHSLTDQIPDGPFGRVIESITHWKDEERLREISKDAQRGLQWLAQQGYSVGGFPPFGYKKSAPIQVGHKKNGEPRLAHKWEIDTECEDRVRKAWEMKIRGELNWTIHHETRVYRSINCYTTFFSNVTYAGYRKCAELIVPNAHPAYVSKADFDKIQERREPMVAGRPKGSRAGHPRRRSPTNPYLLTGVLFCGYCGAAMNGHLTRHVPSYRCGKQKLQGREVCQQTSVVSHAVHTMIVDWLTEKVVAVEALNQMRQTLNERQSGAEGDLTGTRQRLQEELMPINRRIDNLLNALEESGWSREIESRLSERRAEKVRIEAELSQVEALVERGKVELSAEALAYMSEHLTEQLRSSDPASARAAVQRFVKRIEMHKGRLVVTYAPPLVDVLSSQLHGYRQCPHGNSNPGFGLERAAS